MYGRPSRGRYEDEDVPGAPPDRACDARGGTEVAGRMDLTTASGEGGIRCRPAARATPEGCGPVAPRVKAAEAPRGDVCIPMGSGLGSALRCRAKEGPSVQESSRMEQIDIKRATNRLLLRGLVSLRAGAPNRRPSRFHQRFKLTSGSGLCAGAETVRNDDSARLKRLHERPR